MTVEPSDERPQDAVEFTAATAPDLVVPESVLAEGGGLSGSATAGGFWSSALVFVSGAIVLQGINFLAQPLFAWLMPPSEWGVVANYLFWMTVFSLLVSMQTNATLNNAVNKYGREHLGGYLATVVPAFSAPVCVLLAVLLIGGGFWERTLGLPLTYLVLALLNGALVAVANLATSHAVATGWRRRYLKLTFASTLAPLVLGFALVPVMAGREALARILAYVIAGLGVAVWLAIGARVPHTPRQRAYLTYALALALPLLVHELLFLIINQSNRVFLLTIAGEEQTGIFAFANSMGNVAVLIAVAINSAWTPWYFARTKAGDHDLVRRSAKQMVVLYVAVMLAAILVARDVLKLMTRPAYDPGGEIISLFVLAGVFAFIFNVSTNYILYRDATRWVLVISGVAGALSVTLNLVLIPALGIMGAAVAALVSTAWLALAAMVVAVGLLKSPNLPVGVFLLAMAAGTAVLVVEHWAANLVGLRWGLAVAIAVCAGVPALLAWRRSRRERPITM